MADVTESSAIAYVAELRELAREFIEFALKCEKSERRWRGRKLNSIILADNSTIVDGNSIAVTSDQVRAFRGVVADLVADMTANNEAKLGKAFALTG